MIPVGLGKGPQSPSVGFVPRKGLTNHERWGGEG